MKNRDVSPWETPSEVSREEVVRISQHVLAMPEIRTKIWEDVFRMRVLEMDWDIGVMVYEPEEGSKVPAGPDGKKVGIFLLHGGMGDYKSLDPLARTISGKFGLKVASMTFPGRLYLLDPSRDWPGDTLNPDGSARTPLWARESRITPDQYEIIRDQSQRSFYGTIITLHAKEETEFYYRMAAWPAAFEEAMKKTCQRHFQADEYSVYIHGHSTGGPLAMAAIQRIANMRGLLGYGTAPFGYIRAQTGNRKWDFSFNSLWLRTWRDTARYAQEDLMSKGYSLPLLMELVFERWEKGKARPNFKAEDFIHKNNIPALTEAARVTAKRLGMNPVETEGLIRRYVGYCRELSGSGVKPVPPLLFIHGIKDDTVTFHHALKSLPMFAAMKPAPKVRCVLLGAGIHSWSYVDEDLPNGVVPTVSSLWHDAIMGGYFMVPSNP